MNQPSWSWGAYGKHPAFRDYIHLGKRFPIMHTLSEWMSRSYERCVSERSEADARATWLFWGRGFRKHEIVCGLLKDSCDGIGRPYPLLMLGAGPLHDWERYWDLLPLACARCWTKLEALATGNQETARVLDCSLHSMDSPEPRWSDYVAERERALLKGSHETGDYDWSSAGEWHGQQQDTSDGMSVTLLNLRKDNSCAIYRLNRDLREKDEHAPNAFFIGGTPEQSMVVMLRRPLQARDFGRILFGAARNASLRGAENSVDQSGGGPA